MTLRNLYFFHDAMPGRWRISDEPVSFSDVLVDYLFIWATGRVYYTVYGWCNRCWLFER